jgi:hypothetical protein
MACGTEASSPNFDTMGTAKGTLEKTKASRAAMILGTTTEKSTPVLAVSPGALELLPNHLYPGAWLHVRVMRALGPAHAPSYEVKGDAIKFRETAYDYLHLPGGSVTNPYDLYRDTTSWYKLVDLALVDPAGKYEGNRGAVEKAVKKAIDIAEKFHRDLGEWYHPRTFAFYGNDQDKLSFGQVRWIARQEVGSKTALTAGNVAAAEYFAHTPEGHRLVRVEGETELHFKPEPQDARGDGTVPNKSGSGPAGKVRQVFATRGYDHQHCYNDEATLLLTQRLVAMIAQEVPVQEVT